MKDILEKISSYNIFNYLIPGTLFAVIAKEISSFNFVKENIIEGLFVYYFLGLIISRFGSLFVELFLKKIKFVKFAEYKDYVSASKKDTKIELLSEINNTFRTFCSAIFLLILLKIYDWLKQTYHITNDVQNYVLLVLILLLFLYSYRKQTNYITKRINANQ